MLRSQIEAIPIAGDVTFRERAVEPDKTALLLIDLQKGRIQRREMRRRARSGIPVGPDRECRHPKRQTVAGGLPRLGC